MVILTAVTIVAGRTVGYFKNTTVTFGQFLSHLAYAQPAWVSLLNVAFWTLCLEVQFYLFSPRPLSPSDGGPLESARSGSLLLRLVLFDQLLDAISQDWFPSLWYQFGVGVLVYYSGQERSARLALRLLLPILAGFGVYWSQAADITVALVAGLLLSSYRLSKSAAAWPGFL